jgi:hypothetical protein
MEGVKTPPNVPRRLDVMFGIAVVSIIKNASVGR